MSMEPVDPSLRASDAERDAVAARLREAHAEGRLTADEFADRLDAALAARTHADLVPLTSDLPAEAPISRARTGDEAAPARQSSVTADRVWRGAWGAWATAVLVNVVIWALVSISAGDIKYFWPIWVAGPWGAVLLAGTLFARAGRR